MEGLASKKVEFESVFDLAKMTTGPKLPGGKEVEIPQFEKGEEYDKPGRKTTENCFACPAPFAASRRKP